MSRWSLWASLSSSAKLDADLDCWFVKQGCLANTLREFSLSNQDQASSWEFWLRTGVRAGHTYVFRILCWFWRLRISGLSGKGQTRGRGWADYCYCCCCWVAQSWPTLCYPMDCGLPGSSMHGISQTRVLEWVAMSYSRGSSWPRDWTRYLLHWQADSLPLHRLGSLD